MRPLKPEEIQEAEVEGWNATPIINITLHATTGSSRLVEVCGVAETGWRRADAQDKARILRKIAGALDTLTTAADEVRRREGQPWTHKGREHEGAGNDT